MKLPVEPTMQFLARSNIAWTLGSFGANSFKIMMRDSASSFERKRPEAPLARFTSFSNSLRYTSACWIRMERLDSLTVKILLSTIFIILSESCSFMIRPFFLFEHKNAFKSSVYGNAGSSFRYLFCGFPAQPKQSRRITGLSGAVTSYPCARANIRNRGNAASERTPRKI